MEVVATSFLAILVIVVLAVQGPLRGFWIFLAATALGAAAAFNMPALGGASILVADLGALTIFMMVALHSGGLALIVGTMRPGQPGFWLILLVVFGLFATLFFPALFRGQTEVFSLSRDLDGGGIVRSKLRPSTGNLTQLFRLILGGAIFFATATVFRVRPDARIALIAVAITTGFNAALGWLDVLTYAIGLPEALDILRSANYSMLDAATMGGIKRMVGAFPEASTYGYFSLGLFGFWLRFWFSQPKSLLGRVMLALATVAVLRSTSSAAYVAFVAYVVTVTLGLALVGARQQVNRHSVSIALSFVMAAWLSVIVVVVSYELVTPIRDFFDTTLFDKLEGDSGVERMSWNAQAFLNFAETYGLGAGLGSVRGSSWLMATLASIGVIGTALYLMFIGSVLFNREAGHGGGERASVIRALRSGALALLISSLLTGATPDLGLIFFAFLGLATGLARGAQLERGDEPNQFWPSTAISRNNPPPSARL